jgi:hypothetical protein
LLRAGQPFLADAADQVLVIGVATWSDPDLIALERLAKYLRGRNVKVVVFDVDDWRLSEILKTFPGAHGFKTTPFVIQYRFGEISFTGEGHAAVLWLHQF